MAITRWAHARAPRPGGEAAADPTTGTSWGRGRAARRWSGAAVLLALGAAPVLAPQAVRAASPASTAAHAAHGRTEPLPAPEPGSAARAPAKAPGASAKPPVSLAEVASRAEATSTDLPNVTDLLRQDVEAEIASTDWSKTPPRKQYKLSAAIVTLSAAKVDPKTLRASCTVSVSIRDAKRGNLLATLEGRARVEDAPSASAQAQRDALAGAVKGAIAAVPEAIRRAP